MDREEVEITVVRQQGQGGRVEVVYNFAADGKYYTDRLSYCQS